jgi:hypothetical protein
VATGSVAARIEIAAFSGGEMQGEGPQARLEDLIAETAGQYNEVRMAAEAAVEEAMTGQVAGCGSWNLAGLEEAEKGILWGVSLVPNVGSEGKVLQNGSRGSAVYFKVQHLRP